MVSGVNKPVRKYLQKVFHFSTNTVVLLTTETPTTTEMTGMTGMAGMAEVKGLASMTVKVN